MDKIIPGFDDDKGVSLILLNTEKGEGIFKDSKEELFVEEVNLENCLQTNLRYCYPPPKSYDDFWREYALVGMEGILEKYEDEQRKQDFKMKETKKRELKNKIKKRIKRGLGIIWKITVGE